jgi:hypothetical protein
VNARWATDSGWSQSLINGERTLLLTSYITWIERTLPFFFYKEPNKEMNKHILLVNVTAHMFWSQSNQIGVWSLRTAFADLRST